MKSKIFLAFILSVCFIFVSCCKEDPVVGPENKFDIVGLWLDENLVEENEYLGNGINRVYATFCTTEFSGTAEGLYQLTGDSKSGYKLSWDYNLLNTRIIEDYTITNFSENSFSTVSKTAGTNSFTRIKDVITLSPNQSITYPADLSNATIIDSRYLTIEGGQITSTGMKGKTYIKVNGVSPYYIKVLIGTEKNYYDLWHDYSNLLGKTSESVDEELGLPTQYGKGTDGTEQSIYANMYGLHSQVNHVNFLYENGKVEQIHVSLNETATEMQIREFLSKKFHSNIVDGSVYYYTSLPYHDSTKDSPLMFEVVYDTSKRRVVYKPLYEEPGSNKLWDNPTAYFGYSKTKTRLLYMSDKYELTSDVSGALQYKVNDSKSNISIISPRFYGPDDTMSSFLLQYKDNFGADRVNGFLKQDCYLTKSGTRPNGNMYFYFMADDGSYGVTHNVTNRVVTYFNMYWPDFTVVLDKDKAGVTEQLGEGREMDKSLAYTVVDNQFIKYVLVSDMTGNGKYNYITIRLQDDLPSSLVVNFYNLLYTSYSSAADGSRYVWLDTPVESEATAMIMYEPEKNEIAIMSTVDY